MDNPYTMHAAVFLLQTVFGIFLLLVMLRLLLQLVRGDFYNPISQFVVKSTAWALRPLRRIIPAIGGIDTASIILLLAVQMLSLYLIGMARGFSIPLAAITIQSFAALIKLLFTIYTMTIIAQAILSWIGPGTYHPIVNLLYMINEPVLRPVRRFIPPISGLDLSPLITIVIIQLLIILVVSPISGVAISLGYPATLLL